MATELARGRGNTCGENCWTPLPCPTCGREVPPRGRSVAYANQCCFAIQYTPQNVRHLWSVHDDVRGIHDPAGWLTHVAGCEECSDG